MFDQFWSVSEEIWQRLFAAIKQGPGAYTPTSTVAVSNRNGIAIIQAAGLLTRNPSFLQAIFGGASTAELQKAVSAAIANPEIKAVCLVLETPGGSTGGISEFADVIYAARQTGKPVVLQVSGMLASAGYHFGSQASKIYASHWSDQIGAIGTIAVLPDSSKQSEMQGVEMFVATTGKLKAIGVPGVALTDAMRSYIQDTVKERQAEFTAAIQRGRGLSEQQLKAVSDGRMMNAKDAIGAGLIDGIQTLEQTLAMLQSQKYTGAATMNSRTTSQTTVVSTGQTMNGQTTGAAAVNGQTRTELTVAQTTGGTATTGQTGQKRSYKEIFQEGVAKLVASGMSRSQAASQYVRQCPDIHQAMLLEAAGRLPSQIVKTTPLTQTAPVRGERTKAFMDGVAMLRAAGMTPMQAVTQFAKTNPELHQAMLAEARGE